MVFQLRVYTINGGMMDQWVEFFNETLMPIYKQQGIKVEGAWANEDKNQFIWVRSFSDAADLKTKEEAFYASTEWNAAKDRARSHLARVDVQVMDSVLK
jgi:hypothetical protein